jgi:hypothetical protein
MGMQGMRAIWIERRRAATVKRVVGCHLAGFDQEDEECWEEFGTGKRVESEEKNAVSESNDGDIAHRNGTDHESDWNSVLNGRDEDGDSNSGDVDGAVNELLPVPLEGKVVYSLHSYDLRGVFGDFFV